MGKRPRSTIGFVSQLKKQQALEILQARVSFGQSTEQAEGEHFPFRIGDSGMEAKRGFGSKKD